MGYDIYRKSVKELNEQDPGRARDATGRDDVGGLVRRLCMGHQPKFCLRRTPAVDARDLSLIIYPLRI
jgi:hypothetical protein